MDEEIHMEQAQNYCKGYLFRYDPRISTPPGLYVWPWLLSVLTRLLPVAGLDSFVSSCSFSLYRPDIRSYECSNSLYSDMWYLVLASYKQLLRHIVMV